jgi:hypothetical protein
MQNGSVESAAAAIEFRKSEKQERRLPLLPIRTGRDDPGINLIDRVAGS